MVWLEDNLYKLGIYYLKRKKMWVLLTRSTNAKKSLVEVPEFYDLQCVNNLQ